MDVSSVEEMIQAAIVDGLSGLFLGGTCGEGAWLTNSERVRLVRAAVRAANGRLAIAAQVSDNSVPRFLDNVYEMAEAGANYGVMAPPATMFNPTPERITALFAEALTASPLPMGVYDLGARRAFPLPLERLREIYLLPNVCFVKDSSAEPARRSVAVAARQEKPGLRLFNGDEFLCLDYLKAGYDGLLFGGAAAVAPYMHRIVELFQVGQLAEAAEVERRMRMALYGLYGGESLTCWLTGLKYYMVRRGLFTSSASYLGYPLTDECRAFIERYARDGVGADAFAANAPVTA